MPAEDLQKQPVAQASLSWRERPGPGAMRDRNLSPAASVGKYPGLSGSTRSNVRIGRVEMPAGSDEIVVVTAAAGLLSRKRQNRVVVGANLVTLFGDQRNLVNRMGHAAVALVAQKFLLGVRCGSKMAQCQQTQKGGQRQSILQCTLDPYIPTALIFAEQTGHCTLRFIPRSPTA